MCNSTIGFGSFLKEPKVGIGFKNPIPTAEHFRRSHPQCEQSYGQHIYMSEEIMSSKIKTLFNELNTHVN